MQKLTPDKARELLAALASKYEGEEQKVLDRLTKAEREKIGRPIKGVHQLDEFTANGVKYVIHTSLSINRFEQFEKLQVQVGYGVDFRNLFKNLRKSYDYLNGGQPADAAVMVYNIMNGVKNNIDDRDNEVLDLCALFICREDEDLAQYDEKLNKAKKEDWALEGIAMESFFSLAFNLVNGFTPIYKAVSGSISEHLEKVREEIGESPKKSKK